MIAVVNGTPEHIRRFLEVFKRVSGGENLKTFRLPKTFLPWLEGNPENVDLIVLPIHSYTDGLLDEDYEKTQHGSRTGVVLHDHVRIVFPEVPVIFLTQIRDDGLLPHLDSLPNTRVFRIGRNSRDPKDILVMAHEMGVNLPHAQA